MSGTWKRCLWILCFFFVSSFGVEALSAEHSFKLLWENQGDIGRNIEVFTSDADRLIRVTKHLIGSKHVLDIAEVGKQLPADFLFSNSSEKVDLLKFLRELYCLNNNGQAGHAMGDMYALRNADSWTNKYRALDSMREKFRYRLEGVLEENRLRVLDKVSELLSIVEQNCKIERAKSSVSVFHRQLENSKSGSKLLDSLGYRIPKELGLYRQAGLDVLDLEEIVYTDGKIDPLKIKELKVDLRPLISALISLKETKLNEIDAASLVDELAELINSSFFKGKSKELLDQAIYVYFSSFVKKYLNEFLMIVSKDRLMAKRDVKDIQRHNIGVSFEKVFSGDEFKEFVSRSIEKNLTLRPPNKQTIVILSLRSDIRDDILGSTSSEEVSIKNSPDLLICVGEIDYFVCSAYLATFFPQTYR